MAKLQFVVLLSAVRFRLAAPFKIDVVYVRSISCQKIRPKAWFFVSKFKKNIDISLLFL